MNRICLALVTAWLTAGCCVCVAEESASVDALEGLVTTWVNLRAEIAKEKTLWRERKTQWTREIELLKKEQAALKQRVANAGDTATTRDAKQEALVARRKGLADVLRDLGPVLDRLEVDLRRWDARVPESLATEIQALVARIPATHKEAQRRTVAQRLQTDVALLTQIETLHHGLHVTREVLPVKDTKRGEVDVLYLGLAQGFAVSTDGSWAAVGRLGDSGWTWVARPDIAGDVRRALAVFNRDIAAELVRLPLRRVQREVDTAARGGAR